MHGDSTLRSMSLNLISLPNSPLMNGFSMPVCWISLSFDATILKNIRIAGFDTAWENMSVWSIPSRYGNSFCTNLALRRSMFPPTPPLTLNTDIVSNGGCQLGKSAATYVFFSTNDRIPSSIASLCNGQAFFFTLSVYPLNSSLCNEACARKLRLTVWF